MCQLIHGSAKDSLVWQCAIAAVDDYLSNQTEPFQDSATIARGCWWYVKRKLQFVHHSKLIADWFAEKDQLQLLIEPSVLVRMPAAKWAMVGDCAIYSMLLCSMLESLEVPWRLVTLAVDPRQPILYTHVFPQAQMPDGSWLTLDASHGQYPGWQVPDDHVFRYQAWDEAGQPIEEREKSL